MRDLTLVFLSIECHKVPDFVGRIVLPGGNGLSRGHCAEQANGERQKKYHRESRLHGDLLKLRLSSLPIGRRPQWASCRSCGSTRRNSRERFFYFGGGMAGSPCRNGATVFDIANPFTWSQLTDHVIRPRSPG